MSDESLGGSRAALKLRLQLRLLIAIRDSPERCASIDTISDLAAKFGDGGRWRGQAVLELARAGLIAPAGAINSRRVGRKRGLCRWWRGQDDAAITVRIDNLKVRLDAFEANDLKQKVLPFPSG